MGRGSIFESEKDLEGGIFYPEELSAYAAHERRMQEPAYQIAREKAEREEAARQEAENRRIVEEFERGRPAREKAEAERIARENAKREKEAQEKAAKEKEIRDRIERMVTAVKNGDLNTLQQEYKTEELRDFRDSKYQGSLLLIAAQNNQVDIINYLIDIIKIPVNSCDKNNDTALHYAAHFGANEAIQALISKGANIRLKNKADPGLTAEQVVTNEHRLSDASKFLLHVVTPLETFYKMVNLNPKVPQRMREQSIQQPSPPRNI